MLRGKIKFYNPDKGYGFIVPIDGNEDHFVHASSLEKGTVLAEGDEVLFESTIGKVGKRQAINVKLVR